MSLGQAFENADELLTLLALIPVLFGLLVFVNNIGDPNYDAIQAFNNLITNLVYALVPWIEGIIIIWLLIWFARNSSGF